eukprot:TRINITY_DN29459_c0_g1_i1.p1 TRINITY_DN29459_c0_g1~~TRINITY_DN29459_c0_g1_i1.p1  ORF type:complete len:374 (-),score=79.05 TRINITY_DN29459_c0_g1_i1:282-1364(-)
MAASVAAGADAGAGTPPPVVEVLALAESALQATRAASDVGANAFAVRSGDALAVGSDVSAAAPVAPIGSVSAAAEAAAGGAVAMVREDADLREYSESLGVDMDTDVDLLWVVEEAFHAPLPRNWTEHTDDAGRCFFFHEASSQSTWEHPTDAVYRELLGLLKVFREEPRAEQRAAYIHDHLRQVHQRAMVALEGWSGPYASEVGEYWYNEILKVSTWENPVEEWEHEMAIRHAVLCRCLLPEHTVVGSDGSISAAGDARSQACLDGANLLQALQLPLNLVRRDVEQHEAPSTTRSYYTARSVASTRSQQASSRSGEKFARDKANGQRSPQNLQSRARGQLPTQDEMNEDLQEQIVVEGDS